MKTAINSLKMMVLTLTAIFMLSFTTTEKGLKINEVAELQYLGQDANLPVFRLVLNSNTADYVVTVREANGDLLFTEKIKSGTASRIYKLDSENADDITGTTFEVVNKSTKQTSVYKLKNYSRTVENDVIVAKL
jgi:predicted phage gp36 major capsid-like protein